MDPDPRRPGRDLGAVEEVQPLPLRRRRLARLPQLGERVVERRGRNPAGVLLEEIGDVLEQPVEPAPGLRGDGDQRRPLPKLGLDPGPNVLDRDLGLVPLGEDDERRVARLARDVGDGEVLVDDPLARVDQDEGDVGPLGGLERAELRVVVDPLPLLPLAAQAGRVDELIRPAVALEDRVDRVARRARARRRRSRAPRRRARSAATTCRRSAGRGSRRGSPLRRPAPARSPGSRSTIWSSRSPVPCPCSAESGNGSPSPSLWNSIASRSRRGSSILFASTITGFFAARRVTASSSSPGVIPWRASTTKSTRSASAIAARACCAILGLNGVGGESSTPPVSIEQEVLAVPVGEQLLAVARHARRLVHDGLPRLGQPVDQRRLADVREADDRDGADDLAASRRACGGFSVSLIAAASPACGRPSACISASQSWSTWSRRSISATPRGSPSRPSAARRSGPAHPRRPRSDGSCRASTVRAVDRGRERPGRCSCTATIAAPGCTCARDARALARSLDEEAERVPVADDLAHSPHGLAVGLAAPDGDRPEAPDQLAEPGHAMRLDLGEEVHRARRGSTRRRAGRSSGSG